MINPKCKSCDRYISVIELKSSGEPYKSCNKCRNIQKKIYNNKNNKEDSKEKNEPKTDNKNPVNNIIYDKMPDKMIVEGDEYVLTKKTINKARRDEYMMSKYGELNPDINENIVYPDNLSSFTYTSPLKMTEEQMEKMGIKIRSDLDNNISVNNNITDINMTGVLEAYNKLTAL